MEALVQHLVASESKRHDLLTWCIGKFELISNDTGDSLCKDVLEQLNELLKHLSTVENPEEYNSHYIFVRVSQLYTLCLCRLEREHPGFIFDSSEFLIKVLSEDEVTGKDSKKAAKKHYTYSTAKDFACTVLIQITETYGAILSTLAPLLVTVIFKNLKKIMEKSKQHHATYMTLLLQLYNSILRNCKDFALDSSLTSKFVKLSKNVFYDIYNDKRDFPVNFISTIIELWITHFTQDSFLKDNSGDITNVLYSKFIESEIGIYGFSNDASRIITARALAEILFHYYYVKKNTDLNRVWKFFVKTFNNATSRDTKSGCFEAIIHFIGLCLATDGNFLNEDNYFSIVRSLCEIFNTTETEGQQMDSLSRSLRYLRYMHDILLPRLGDSSKSEILFKILGSSSGATTEAPIDSNKSGKEVKNNQSIDTQWFTLAQLDLARIMVGSLSSSFGTEERIVQQIKTRIIELSTCENFNIRVHSNEVLKEFLFSFPEYLTETIENSLSILTADFDSKNKFVFSKSHGHSVIIANLIDIADKNYVSYELIMRITIFATAFTKRHTTSTNNDLYYKGIICWILLIGLMNYKDEQYLSMQKSQLFLFWKVLLTHSFTYHGEEELYRNLEIRNHAMTCLLTYLNRATIDKDMAKQVSYLLTKCSNFNHSVTLKSTNIDTVLLMNENRILQIYLTIHDFVKADFNSSLLILIVKNFSNPKLFTEATRSVLASFYDDKKSRSMEEGKEEIIMETTVNNLLRINDDFAFGLSSKVNNNGISELSFRSVKQSSFQISGNWPSQHYYWYYNFENEVFRPISPVLSLDYLSILYDNNKISKHHTYSPRVTTSVIDSSMDIFSMVFPYLNNKIQSSLIENLNLLMFSKTTSPLRRVAIAANVCVAIYNALRIIQEKDLILDVNVGKLMIDSIKRIEFYNDTYITKLKADCIGLLTAAVVRGLPEDLKQEFIISHTHVMIKNVVEVTEPHFRVFHALSLATIFRYNSQFTSFEPIFEVIIALVKDPHPVVHSWSLKALDILLEKYHVIDMPTTSILLGTLEDVLTDPSYGLYGSSTLCYNYNKEFNSYIAVGQIVKTITEITGPSIPDFPKASLDSFRNMTISFLLSNNIISQMLSIQIYENIATFKLNGIVADQIFIRSAKRTVFDAVTTGIGSSYYNSTFTKTNEIIPNTSSLTGAFENFNLFSQLFKLQKKSSFVKEMDNLSWIYLSLYPSSESVVQYFFEWLDNSLEEDQHWFDKLNLIFGISRFKVFQRYYKTLDEVLNLKGFTSLPELVIREEEKESINKESNIILKENKETDKLQWQSKEVILQLIKNILEQKPKNKQIIALLTKSIPDLIRVSCQACAMRIKSIKYLGLLILNNLLINFSHIRDHESPENSILEQQEARITSALMPIFDKGISPDTIAFAINVASELLASNIAPLSRSGRISRLLVSLLTTFDQKHSIINVGESTIITHKAKRNIELAVLNAWASLVQRSLINNNKELIEFTKQYWDILVPLWIISLREYIMVKYEVSNVESIRKQGENDNLIESKGTKLELYESVWLNFVEVLGSLLEKDQQLILKSLGVKEMESFIFILFSQCLESITVNFDNSEIKGRVLPAIHNVLKCNVPLTLLFEDNIHSETVGILERLILTGSCEEKLVIVDIINDLIYGYTIQNTTQEDFLQGIDKLYELLRLLLMVISELIPFIKFNSLEATTSEHLILTKSDTELLKRALSVFELNVSQFDDVFKVDLYTCLLYIIGRIYEADCREIVVPLILPLLKSITNNIKSKGMDEELLDKFYGSVKNIIFNELRKETSLATILILVSNGYSGFSDEEIGTSIELFVECLHKEETQIIAAHGLRSVFRNSMENDTSSILTMRMIKRFSSDFKIEKSITESKLIFELVVIFAKYILKKKHDDSVQAISIALSFTMWYYSISSSTKKEAGGVLLDLVKLDSEGFKTAINNIMTADQRLKIEKIVDYATNSQPDSTANGAPTVELKSFI